MFEQAAAIAAARGATERDALTRRSGGSAYTASRRAGLIEDARGEGARFDPDGEVGRPNRCRNGDGRAGRAGVLNLLGA